MKTRRQFFEVAGLAGAGVLAGSAAKSKPKPKTAPSLVPGLRPLIKPRALKSGDTVALIAPSSYIFDVWRIDDAVTRLASLGLKTRIGRFAKGRHGYMAGTEKERLEDLHAALA